VLLRFDYPGPSRQEPDPSLPGPHQRLFTRADHAPVAALQAAPGRLPTARPPPWV
jgi:hypothetical protein